LALVAGCSTVPRSFHPAEPIAPQEFSYQAFDGILHAHVKDGVVDYPGVAADQRFRDHLHQLGRVDPNRLPTRQDRLAFWINAYNAFAIQGILDGYSPLTLAGRYRYFIGRGYRVGGETITLYDLERKLLIPDFREPRIHFAIVCASRSCPRLPSRTYRPDRLEEQLEQSARAFINDPTRNRFDRAQKVAYLSMIFKWFEEEFAEQSGSLLSYVKRYVVEPDLAKELETVPYTVQFLPYDWGLNGPPPGGSQHGGSS
jgi:hypothetical protein